MYQENHSDLNRASVTYQLRHQKMHRAAKTTYQSNPDHLKGITKLV